MRYSKMLLYLIAIFALSAVESCKSILDEPLYSQLAPENFLNTQEGINSLLNAGYAELSIIGNMGNNILHAEEWCTDIEWETGGGANRNAIEMIDFNWDPSLNYFDFMWQPRYNAIRDANIVLGNIKEANISDNLKDTYSAEARFVRATSYYYLYQWFGPVPLRTSTEDSLYLQRATEDEMKSFIESEYLAIIPLLPSPGNEVAYGRANSGAARGLICKFYLNTKQWQKCADMAKEIIDNGHYQLYPTYKGLFKVENEQNKEFIWVHSAIAKNELGNQHMNGAFPPKFEQYSPAQLTMKDNWNNWARQDRLLDDFYNSFEPDDKRKSLIISKYINTAGDTISLRNNDNTRSFKYWPDPNAVSNDHGNDVPDVRYADILLSRAEALNELNGPNEVSVDLINKIRTRAGLQNISLASFSSKEALNDEILKERRWEFYSERKRREDLIRMGKFISSAIDRGHGSAKPYMVRFPIPQQAMDANPQLVQNKGY